MRAWMRWILAILDLRLRFTLHTFAGCGGRKAAWRRALEFVYPIASLIAFAAPAIQGRWVEASPMMAPCR